MSDEYTVTNNEAEQRYEIHLGEDVAVSRYRLNGTSIAILHTEVPQAFEGRGIGSALIRGLLEDVRRRNLVVIPHCPFVRAYLQENPEYLPCVEESYRQRLRAP